MLLLRVTNISANCDCTNICKSAKQAASLVYTKRAQDPLMCCWASRCLPALRSKLNAFSSAPCVNRRTPAPYVLSEPSGHLCLFSNQKGSWVNLRFESRASNNGWFYRCLYLQGCTRTVL